MKDFCPNCFEDAEVEICEYTFKCKTCGAKMTCTVNDEQRRKRIQEGIDQIRRKIHELNEERVGTQEYLDEMDKLRCKLFDLEEWAAGWRARAIEQVKLSLFFLEQLSFKEKESKRFKEALEYYANIWTVVKSADQEELSEWDHGQRAREALGGNK